ncbi:MAG: sugar phosphate isomerase/epimerase [Phycisphaerales bacterium]|nr:MAG: sugar phosphate isomerase/epimerase [Phycisphaerales bacterium]
MKNMNRRTFLQTAAVTGLAGSVLAPPKAFPAEGPRHKFTMNLNTGQVGLRVSQLEAVKLAAEYGYGSVTPMTRELGRYSDAELEKLKAEMKAGGITWGATGMGPFFDPADAKFDQRLTEIRKTAGVFKRAGVTRCFTWTMSSSRDLTYRANFRLHVRRISQVGKILGDHGVRFGIEYLGTSALAVRQKFPFIRTSAETKELLAEVGLSNVGLALDSWHWFQAGETEHDILKLAASDVITADICDAPAGIDRRQMPDSPRRLPCATGVIDVKAFLRGLVRIGYDGPVGTEPFDRSLRTMSTADAMKTATDAMKKAFALIE